MPQSYSSGLGRLYSCRSYRIFLVRLCQKCYFSAAVSTLQEIKSAITRLNTRDQALLAAELFAMNIEPDEAQLEAALQRGLKDVEAGRVRQIEEVKAMIPRWTAKS